MRRLVLCFAVAVLAACAGAQTPAQRLFAAQANLNAALAVAATYVEQPPCDEKLRRQCADPAVKIRIQDLASEARDALAAASKMGGKKGE